MREAVIKFAESAGGKIDAFYFAFGQYDAVAIADYPDNVSAVAALCCTDQHPGAVRLPQRHLREANVLRPPKLDHPV